MNPKFEEELKLLLQRIEAMKEPIRDGDPTEYFQALGVHQGMTTLAGQIRAMMETQPEKQLTLGCPVLVINGPYKDSRGYYQGLAATPVGAQAEVLLENVDLPVLIQQEYIKAI